MTPTDTDTDTHRTRRLFVRTIGLGLGGLVLAGGGHGAAASSPASADETQTVRVAVIDSQTGEPVPEFALTVDTRLIETTTGTDGVARIDLPDGQYDLRAAGYPEYMHAVVEIDVHKSDQDITIELPPGPAYDERDDRDEGELDTDSDSTDDDNDRQSDGDTGDDGGFLATFAVSDRVHAKPIEGAEIIGLPLDETARCAPTAEFSTVVGENGMGYVNGVTGTYNVAVVAGAYPIEEFELTIMEDHCETLELVREQDAALADEAGT